MGYIKARRAVAFFLVLLYAALFFALLPYPAARYFAGEDLYLCRWSDGTVTEETAFSACRDFAFLTKEEAVLLRDGKEGKIVLEEPFAEAYRILSEGELAELLSFRTPEDPLQSAALRESFSKVVWADGGECFHYTGEAVVRGALEEAERFVLLGGSATPSAIGNATSLRLGAQAEFTFRALLGTRVQTVETVEPYAFSRGAVFLHTAGGTRLVAGLPLAVQVSATDMRFADEGALLPCTKIEALELAFVGSAENKAGSLFRGELAYLFSTGSEYRVPESLRSLRVHGGVLVSHAFYGCGMLEEIDACGVAAEDIEDDAFSDCTNLRSLHVARGDLHLQGFTARGLSCGCTLYTKTDGGL